MEGAPRPHQNPFCYCRGVVEHRFRRNVEDCQPLFPQPNLPVGVAFDPRRIVRSPVDLDNQLCLAAEKIHGVGINGMLPPKFKPPRLPTQALPEEHFRQRHFLAKLAGFVDCRTP